MLRCWAMYETLFVQGETTILSAEADSGSLVPDVKVTKEDTKTEVDERADCEL